jgi:HTH-type transcriptional repressor of NAD biosynthesis genes
MTPIAPQPKQKSTLFRVHILGAESTGKTTLLSALEQRLQAHKSAVTTVPETLRDWVAQHGRTPRMEEQLSLARAQERAIAQACLRQSHGAGAIHWVLADTSPMMTAAYSAHYFGDQGLWDLAASFESTADLRLLMGLDLPWQADEGQRDGPRHQQAVDVLLRDEMQRRHLPFVVIYGQDEQRTQAAWRAIQAALKARQSNAKAEHALTRKHWRAACECCADPECELALFNQALGQ